MREDSWLAFLLEPFPEDVIARVRHDYPPEEVDEVLTILAGVESYVETFGQHIPWIQLAALALAGGKKELIQHWVDLANHDTRDLSLAVNGLLGPGWERGYILYDERS
jgi:hypothetical protein